MGVVMPVVCCDGRGYWIEEYLQERQMLYKRGLGMCKSRFSLRGFYVVFIIICRRPFAGGES